VTLTVLLLREEDAITVGDTFVVWMPLILFINII